MGIRDSSTEPMTPEEAALEMGERGSDILFFVNAETGGAAVVYRRGGRQHRTGRPDGPTFAASPAQFPAHALAHAAHPRSPPDPDLPP